jgi:ribosomal protein L11 methyltransferase
MNLDMNYIQVTFNSSDGQINELLIAMLADAGYDGFEESDSELLAYIEQPRFLNEELVLIAGQLGCKYQTNSIPAQNWNALWESNFQPVFVGEFCTIRAHFHDIQVVTPYEIVITPKMSFGTGHHSTTQLVMMLMKDLDFNGKTVLDFGAGTGVLAIFAEMLGARSVLAIDNDEWSVENGMENVGRNACKNIIVQQASLENIAVHTVDIILANINRHILLQHMTGLSNMLQPGGQIIMSGILQDDEDVIVKAAASVGLVIVKGDTQLNWLALLFEKK